MKYIYIENYLELTQKQKMSFFIFLEKSKELKLINQEMIFEEEAIILRFENNINLNSIKDMIQEYFTKNNIKNINTQIVKKHNTKFDKVILTFINTNKHILI